MDFLKKSKAAMIAALLMLALGGCAAPTPSCPACEGAPVAAITSAPVWTWTRDQRVASAQCAFDAAVAASGTESGTDLRRRALQAPRLHILGGDQSARDAVILIGGIHDTYRYFSSWVTPLAASGKLVIGWDHDHHSMNMANAARLLAQDLTLLRSAGMHDVTLIAHSIGGLVAKGAVDELVRTAQAPAFRRLDLHAFGSPWGGFALMKIVLGVPGSPAVSAAFGYPMASELRPGSSFLLSLAQPMPANGALHLYVGKADHVALPAQSSTRRRYAAAAMNAASVTSIDQASHNDYSLAMAPASLASTPASLAMASHHPCQDGLCNATTGQQRCATHLAAVTPPKPQNRTTAGH